jgi:hypothetical protein
MSGSDNKFELSHATIFTWLLAIATIWHHTSSSNEVFYYWLHFDPVQTPAVMFAVSTAFIAACFPSSTKVFLVFIVTQVAVIFTRIPFIPTHVVMELFLFLTILASYLYLVYKNKSWNIDTVSIFELYAPTGRWLLIIMYFFGTFHKINPGFLSLDSSCALSFFFGLPLPDFLLQQSWAQYSAIYGTLIVEFIAMLLLLFRRTKYYGMLLGIPFHFVIGISSYGALAHFSSFALTLHTLFVPSSFGQRIYNDRFIPDVFKKKNTFLLITIVVVALQFVFASFAAWTLMNILFALFGVVLIFLIFRHGKTIPSNNIPYRLKSSFPVANVMSILFFVHSAGPYIGLNTLGVVQMFSGLRTEGGVSNHYIIQKPLYIFPYQERVVYILKSFDEYLAYLQKQKQGMTMFDFQRYLTTKDTPLALPMSLQVDGKTYLLNDGKSLKAFMNKYFAEQSVVEKKYLSFREVDAEKPTMCRH